MWTVPVARPNGAARRCHLLRLWLTLHRNIVTRADVGGIPVKTAAS
jgi:hypothetical protein